MAQKYRRKGLTCILFLIFILSIFPSINLNHSSLKGKNNLSNDEFLSVQNGEEENSLIKFDYTSINDLILDGDNFTVDDSLIVNHAFSLTLDNANGFVANFTIEDNISDIYSPNSLQYNITLIEATTNETIYMEEIGKADEVISNSVTDFIASAQQFEVSTDYAIFEGAFMGIDITNTANIGTNQLELFVVKEAGGIPDLSDVRTFAVNSPYNSTNYSDFDGLFHYYDFHDEVLEKGFYYVVANLSVIDSLPSSDAIFSWLGDVGYKTGETFSRTHAGIWESSGASGNYDYSLGVRLIASDEFGDPLQYSDPVAVLLQDNSTSITTLDQQIISTGLHNISASIPVEISFNNSYDYSTSYTIQSTVTISNSTFGEYGNTWSLTWSTTAITSPYSNLYRIQQITVPQDWNDVYSLLIDEIPNKYIQKTGNIFDLILYDLDSPSDFKLTNYSPNYINSIFYPDGDNTFNIGYWTHNSTHATGHDGSDISVVVDITNSLISGGDLNFTVFDPNGNIVNLKSDLNSSLDYNDISVYSKLAYYETNRFRANTSFDPSVEGSDTEGFWTVMCCWQNGSEVGFITKKITVLKPTLAEFFVETDVGGIWEKISSTQITRINGETINLRVSYYSISDPFFDGIGTLITSGNVYYTTEWEESASFAFSTTNYTTTIITNVITGNYAINLFAEGLFYRNFTSTFSVSILHQFNLQSIEDEYTTFYTNDLIAKFYLEDLSNASTPVSPDDYWVRIEGAPIIENDDFVYSFIDNKIAISVDTVELGLSIGTYELELSVEKENFIESLGTNQTSTTVFFTIEPIETTIQIESSVTEVEFNSQISLSFRILDQNHSRQIEGATVEVSLDIPGTEVELIENTEYDGLYSIKVRVHEPTIKILNIKVNVTKTGFETIQNFIISSITIVDTQATNPPSDLPIGVIITSAIISAGSIGILVTFLTRRVRDQKKAAHIEEISKVRSIFQSAFMVRRVIVVHHETSLPVYELNLSNDLEIDSTIVSGVLEAISTIGGEISGAMTGIKKLEYHNLTVTSTSSGAYTVYVFTDTELDIELEKELFNLVNWFDITFGHLSLQWDGSLKHFNDYNEIINKMITKALFLWFLLPLEVEPKIMKEIGKYSNINQEIFSLINSKGKATSVLIIDQLSNYTKDELLENIFALVKEEKLKPDFASNLFDSDTD